MVLYYHGILPESRLGFAKQMDLLLRHATPTRADFRVPLPNGRHFACVTFDDAMVSVAEQALPELKKRRIPVTIFAATGKLGHPPDWGNYWDEPLPTEPTMTSEQIRALADEALFGSHSVTHPLLTKVSETDARSELKESREALKQLINKDIVLLSFPYGEFNDDLLKWSREAGYERVFTTLPRVFESDVKSKAAVVGRVSVEPTDWPLEFRLKLLGAYSWRPTAIKFKRKLRSLVYPNKTPKNPSDARRD